MTIPFDSVFFWIASGLIALLGFFLRSFYYDFKLSQKEIETLKARVNVMDGTTGIHISALTKNIDTLTNDIKLLTANVAHMNGNMKVQSEVINKVFEKVLEKK